ncbi:MAG: hypothetical protein Q3M24_01315 [Candidatus Electrothrix aestuarii]|uniref:Uncharacterized protein n=1 Tax=Candidatus Electrothrix aestuarii TaxID=3062594 RepID=A0AAU8LWM5_9BACT|nr:hypothetical protein [Candidatus Electrothrix aestuarii]
MKIIFLFFFMVSIVSNAFSADVSIFDIQGFRLGESFSTVLKKISCQNPEIDKKYLNGKVSSIDLQCDYGKDGFFRFEFEHNEKLYRMTKVFWFYDNKSDYKQIFEKIRSKYGEPKFSGTVRRRSDGEERYSMCWGGCKTDISDSSDKVWKGKWVGENDKEKSLDIEFSKYINRGDGEPDPILVMSLYDPKLLHESLDWYKKKELDIQF